MTMSDPIADMLTRIRNANTAKHDTVDVPASKTKIAIANILVDEGYIEKYEMIEDGCFKTMRLTLKYGADKNEKIITGLKRVSKPGLRIYVGKDELPKVLGGLGIAILSTNQGIITDKEARRDECYACEGKDPAAAGAEVVFSLDDNGVEDAYDDECRYGYDESGIIHCC